MSLTKDDPILCHVETDDELRVCFPVMQELRPHLRDADEFIERVNRMRGQEGYRLFAAWHRGKTLALAGYRIQENLLHGRFLYVDDLVVAGGSRRSRWDARLLRQMESLAAEASCTKLVLDTDVANSLAQRFYFRQGLLMVAVRFNKQVEPGSAIASPGVRPRLPGSSARQCP